MRKIIALLLLSCVLCACSLHSLNTKGDYDTVITGKYTVPAKYTVYVVEVLNPIVQTDSTVKFSVSKTVYDNAVVGNHVQVRIYRKDGEVFNATLSGDKGEVGSWIRYE